MRSIGPSRGQLPHILFGGDERSQLLGDQCVPCEEFVPVDRLAAINSLQVLAQRRFNPRVFGFGKLRLIFQTLAPDGCCPRDRGSRESFPQNKHVGAADRCDYLENPVGMRRFNAAGGMRLPSDGII